MHKHRIQVGLFMSVAHFVILLGVLGFWIAGGFLFEEMLTALGLIGPLFAYIIDHPKVIRSHSDQISLAYRITSFFVPAVFVVVVAAAVILWSFKKGFTSFDQFKVLVGILEGAFGVYVGQFIYSMFKKSEATGEAA